MKKSTKIMIISLVSVIFVLLLVLGITKAFMKPIEQGGNITEVSLNSCAKIKLTSTSNVNLPSSYPMSRNKGLQTTPYKFTVTSYCDSYVGFNLYVATLSTNTIDAKYVRYILTETGTKNVIQEGILSSATNGVSDFTDTEKTELNTGLKGTYGSIYRIHSENIPLKGNISYDLYLFLDGDVADNSTMGKTFKAGVAVKSYDRDPDPPTLAEYVKSLYTGTQGANNVYYHDASLTNGAGDNSYRYAGANPNNYVCFGSDDTTCPTENLYRIIGVIDGKVKLIHAYGTTTTMLGTNEGYVKTYQGAYGSSSSYKGNGDLTKIGTYKWNKSGTNIWSTSTTNTINLNTHFLTYLDSKNTKWKTMIVDTTWYVGGMRYNNGSNSIAKTAYNYEVGANMDASTTVTTKIGLMYVSEYYYAATPDYWTLPGDKYDSSNSDNCYGCTMDYRTAINDNWLYTGLYEWTISRNSDGSDYAFAVAVDGGLSDGDVGYSLGRAVRPSFSLSSSIKFTSGEGTAVNPIRINL